jgi:hypothetical protein
MTKPTEYQVDAYSYALERRQVERRGCEPEDVDPALCYVSSEASDLDTAHAIGRDYAASGEYGQVAIYRRANLTDNGFREHGVWYPHWTWDDEHVEWVQE